MTDKKQKRPLIAVVDSWGGVERGLTLAGAHAEDCSYEVDSGDVEKLVEAVDAVVFTGGGDIDPTYYGQDKSHHVSGVSRWRDDGEVTIARAAIERGLPMMGICRGHQLLNVVHGGTLHQHIPLHGNGRIEHGASEHRVKFSLKSLIGQALRRWQPSATSLHHQAVDRVGDGLVAVGWAVDGTIEAVESVADPYVLGVQFHPELDLASTYYEDWPERIFKHFVGEVRRTMAPHAEDLYERIDMIPKPQTYGYSFGGRGEFRLGWEDDDYGCEWGQEKDRVRNVHTNSYDWWDKRAGRWIHTEVLGDDKTDTPLNREIEDADSVDDFDCGGIVPYLDKREKIDAGCDFPPCIHPGSCDPEAGDCFLAWRALNGGDS